MSAKIAIGLLRFESLNPFRWMCISCGWKRQQTQSLNLGNGKKNKSQAGLTFMSRFSSSKNTFTLSNYNSSSSDNKSTFPIGPLVDNGAPCCAIRNTELRLINNQLIQPVNNLERIPNELYGYD